MIQFDYLGDAVWSLAWRKFEAERFRNFSGHHRCMRCQIVVSNQFMNMVAIAEKIKPLGVSEKALADGLEHFLGLAENKTPGLGVKLAMKIMARRVAVHELQKEIDKRIKANRHTSSIPKRPKITNRFILIDCPKTTLGEFF